ncbi:uncharacterized protein A1O5_12577 [Cladophialophora psammophila CBS 110553]|uniref:Uncharacterized protein n=1 Tax=Cladophialophora psammophila CBS 110553 TaxID=1182543 RepID=W9VTE1_9EURO|nr:uncharacterized protein A1O5_12577 [Cladophialophora psammophila CBS 110553]EXJ56310.1 hypothetical protein A1O5_12577 [Cladophialophora psammophila CBS 110553]
MDSEDYIDIECGAIAQYLRKRQLERLWSGATLKGGVILKRRKDEFLCQPSSLFDEMPGLLQGITHLNAKVALTVSTSVVDIFLRSYESDHVRLQNGHQVQVLPDMRGLLRCRTHRYAAFIKDVKILLVWDNDPTNLIQRTEKLEDQLLKHLWNLHLSNQHVKPSLSGSPSDGSTHRHTAEDVDSAEEGPGHAPKRTVVLAQAYVTALTAALGIVGISFGWRDLVMEIRLDQTYSRLTLILLAPLELWLGWFFYQSVFTNLLQLFGPVSQSKVNSKRYSSIASPRRARHLPHVTIQCPVYKEGLWTVLDPTIASLKRAVSTYEMQGGTANIFVNDDGLQLISDADAKQRKHYYEENHIGWVARPKHCPAGEASNNIEPFVRAGKFKKASNMNYALSLSDRVEELMNEIHCDPGRTQQPEKDLCQDCLSTVLQADKGRSWAGGDIRIGDYILLVDADTRVPEDCLLDAVCEMETSPEVAIMQFSSGSIKTTGTAFEKCFAFFNDMIYTSIKNAVANGDIAPFIGHNAIIRWSALQAGKLTTVDGKSTFWAENCVSEDFEMALRLQSLGYITRFSTIFGISSGFEEGVSLTVYDEVARWEKYAYGCCELIFNPMKDWLFHGPFTKTFRTFIRSDINLTHKITTVGYIGTYFAIGFSWVFALMNYLVLGWVGSYVDWYYIEAFRWFFGTAIVFGCLGTVSLAVHRFRAENRNLLIAFLENLMWLPMITCFFGGISVHVSRALLCHLLSINMTWGSTAKEADVLSFASELALILRKFKWSLTYCVIMTALMIILAGIGPLGHLVPEMFIITGFAPIYPLAMVVGCTFALPLVLNSNLMRFSF